MGKMGEMGTMKTTTRHKMRILLLAIGAAAMLGLSMVLAGCAGLQQWAGDHREGLEASAAFIGKTAMQIGQSVAVGAVSYRDANNKANYMDGVAQAFRQLDYTVALNVTGDEIGKLVRAWTPDRPHWDKAADRFAALWAAYPPQNRREAEIFIEAMACGLNAEAYAARQMSLAKQIAMMFGGFLPSERVEG